MIGEVWAFICVAGFWGWVLCTIGLIIKAFPSRAIFRGRPAATWGGAVVFFYCIWVIAMLNA